MQDPTIFQSIKPQFPEQEQLKCPRCDSTNTKFCYYNNYNLSQPRHFCKNCKRYWTKGGALRNIPIGGGTRKNTKRSSSSSTTTTTATNSKRSAPPSSSSAPIVSPPEPDPTRNYTDQDQRVLSIGGSFSSLLASNTLLGDMSSTGSNLKMVQMEEFMENENSGPMVNSGSGRTHGLELQGIGNNAENFLSMQNGDSSCWNGSNGWSNLAIYNPGSTFQ